jgi:hypothetical protein
MGLITTTGWPLTFACRPDNDLYRALQQQGMTAPRFGAAEEAITAAAEGSGVLLLADGYPQAVTPFDVGLMDAAAAKRLRLYIEYPQALPGRVVAAPRRTELERAVVVSDAFGPSLPPMRLLAIHDCHFVETEAADAHLVLAKVAGFDRAAYGLDDVRSYPLLFELREDIASTGTERDPTMDSSASSALVRVPSSVHSLLVCTTKFSQFITARYAPQAALRAIWCMIFAWLAPGCAPLDLDWTPTVRPSFDREEALPANAAHRAVVRGVDWHTNARMLIHPDWEAQYGALREAGTVDPANPVGPPIPPDWPAGDGSLGVLEGVSSRIGWDGSQQVRWWLRTDSNGESALAFALRWRLDGDARSRQIAANLLDWIYWRSGLFEADPEKGSYGLLRWAWDSDACYGDNCIKVILSGMGTAALLGETRWDERLVQHILANFRTTGVNGYRPNAIRGREIDRLGWEQYWRLEETRYAPHYQAWIWSAYLWLYDKTHDPILLDRTRHAIELMMAAYPDGWRWTNGIQQERGRMLLTLAWLVRVDDRPQHRAWLRQIAEEMRRSQDASGAIREELGDLARGSYRPPRSNAEYGSNEAALIQENGDPVADLLYTCNFTFLGLHEAHAATGDPLYRDMADRLAEFLVRVQVRSEAHAALDGGWFRAFDTVQWDYWGSNADAGWGAWAIEVGWTQGWISTVLALRELGLNLWDLTRGSAVAQYWPKYRELMLKEVL